MDARPLTLAVIALTGCTAGRGSDGPKDLADPVTTITLEPVGSPTPLVWRVHVDSPDPVAVSAVLDAPDHHLALPADPALAATHDLLAKGMHADTTYTVTVTLTDAEGETSVVDGGALTTDPLPAGFPGIVVHSTDPDRQEPGYTLVLLRPSLASGEVSDDYLVAVDGGGEVAWYYEPTEADLLVEPLHDGSLLAVASDPDDDGGPISRFDWEGAPLDAWVPEGSDVPGIECDLAGFHHEAFANPLDGHYLSFTKEIVDVPAQPRSYDDPTLVPARIGADVVVGFDPTAPDCALTEEIHLADLLDTQRIGFDSLEESHFDGELDWAHANGIWTDPSDGGIVVSLRNQDAVIKILDGQLDWILGTSANWRSPWAEKRLMPVGDLEWQFHQHSPQVHPSGDGRLLVMDNGDARTSPFTGEPVPDPADRYSRAVEFRVDEQARTVEQTWVLDRLEGERFYSPYVGDADYLPQTGHVLACFGYLVSVGDQDNLARGYSARTARIVEVGYEDPSDVVLDVEFVDFAGASEGGWTAYRASRVPGLYGLPY